VESGLTVQQMNSFVSSISNILRCPCCHNHLPIIDCAQEIRCLACGTKFPIVRGVPILLNEKSSLFSITETTVARKESTGLRQLVARTLPNIDRNVKAERNYERFAKLLLTDSSQPTVLVIGAGVLGSGHSTLFAHPEIRLIETDVKLYQRIVLACDAHELPFDNASFDGVVCQAVLEHVLDPYQCVQEIHRVLKQCGLVYAETPFMQQVHGGRYDFTRFTDLGHRRLFRRFEEIDRGAVCGPGMALAWAVQYFLLSFAESKTMRDIIEASTRITLFPLKYWDYYLIDKRATLDAASGYYFLGRKSENTLDDKELLRDYRGLIPS